MLWLPAYLIDFVDRFSSASVLFVVGVACLTTVLLFGRTGPRRAGFSASDYRAKPLLSPWEARSLRELCLDLPSGFYACPQVRLADFLSIAERDPARRRAALNRVASKSVDFVIIDDAGRVALVIELDDRSHARADRRERDAIVNAVLAHCGRASAPSSSWTADQCRGASRRFAGEGGRIRAIEDRPACTKSFWI